MKLSLNRIFELTIGIQVVAAFLGLLLCAFRTTRNGDEQAVSGRRPNLVTAVKQRRMSLIGDIWQTLHYRAVAWWALWIILTNPCRVFVMFNWQNLVNEDDAGTDYNGLLVAFQYLVPA